MYRAAVSNDVETLRVILNIRNINVDFEGWVSVCKFNNVRGI